MVEDYLYVNPFIHAVKLFFSLTRFDTPIPRRVDAIQTVVSTFLKEDDAEYADVFLRILAGRIINFYPDRAFGVSGLNLDPNETNHIFRFACHKDTTDQDFLLIIERAALLWEEVDGRPNELFPITSPQESGFIDNETGEVSINDRNDLYISCIEHIAEMLEVLHHPLVLMLPSNSGLRIIIPKHIQKDVFGYHEGFEKISIMQFLRDFQFSSSDVWMTVFSYIIEVVSILDLRPKVVFDAPLMDLSERPDIDADIFIAILEDAIKNLEAEIRVPVKAGPPAPINEAMEMEYADYEFYN